MMVRDKWPEQTVHLSVQANAVNWATVKFWARQGIERVILSRELSIDEIEEIRQQCPDMELEVFVHGALCMAYSGRCLLSGYMTHRDSNQGACTNSCRWQYNVHDARETESGDLIPTHPGSSSAQVFDPDAEVQPVLLQERNRPGELLPTYEDEHGTYIMNSKDLRAVQHVERLVNMGIHSLKIEGRTKSHYYVARTAQVYRRAIDDALVGNAFDPNLMGELEHLANRGYTEGFYRRHVPSEFQNYVSGNSSSTNQQFVGEVTGSDAANGWLTIDVKNRFETGDELELMTPKGNLRFTLKGLESIKGEKIEIAPGSGHTVRVPVAGDLGLGEEGKYALLMRYL